MASETDGKGGRAVNRVGVHVDEQQVTVDNTALRVLDDDGEPMQIDDYSIADGYVVFRESGNVEGSVLADGEKVTLSFRKVPDDG